MVVEDTHRIAADNDIAPLRSTAFLARNLSGGDNRIAAEGADHKVARLRSHTLVVALEELIDKLYIAGIAHILLKTSDIGQRLLSIALYEVVEVVAELLVHKATHIVTHNRKGTAVALRLYLSADIYAVEVREEEQTGQKHQRENTRNTPTAHHNPQ